jgi:hypothetical protein
LSILALDRLDYSFSFTGKNRRNNLSRAQMLAHVVSWGDANKHTRGLPLFLQTASGIALGLLLGALIGLSQSPVAATVVGALTGALALFLGFSTRGESGAAQSTASLASAARTCGFGVACTLAVVFALYARTHDAFSIAVKRQIDALVGAGFTPDEAHAWVAYKNAGLLFRINREMIASESDKRAQTAESVLFADPGVDPCFNFDSKRIPSVDDRIAAMRNSGPRFVALAEAISKMDSARKVAVMDGMSQLFCPTGVTK